MDVQLFLKSLSSAELLQLKNALNIDLKNRITTKEFINKHNMSGRLYRILNENSGSGCIFEYVDSINRMQFLKLPRAGSVMWEELEVLISKNRL
jgi:hypothetical protein